MVEQRRMGLMEWGLLMALSVLWGGSFFFNGVIVRQLPPLTAVALRLVLAALVLVLLIRAIGLSLPRERRVWTAFFGMGLLNNVVPFSLIVWGQTQITSSLAAILNATTPLFAAIVAHVLTADEKLTRHKLVGIMAGFAGVAIMISPSALSGLGDRALAQFAVLGAALSYALAGVFGRRFKAMGVAPLQTATGQITASAVMLVPVALLVDRPWTLPGPSLSVWAAVAGIALLSTALAYVLFFRILATAGASHLMLVTFLIPVSTMLLGWLWLGEFLEARQFVGMALIAAGLVAIDGRLLAALKSRRRTPPDPDHFIGQDI